ncbi:MAG TPA: hypothetical protein VI818_00090, partial [Candidatus Thermoplasmatota archaeon]|nr:hypothetical protein [Candidatus Thermoplasmatota archaeon]
AKTGTCVSQRNWVPPQGESSFFIPSIMVKGPDVDADGLPFDVQLTGYQFYGTSGSLLATPGARLAVPLDQKPMGLDSSASVPDEATVDLFLREGDIRCVSVATGVKLGPDEDQDGVPAYAEVYKLTFQFDTRNVGMGCGQGTAFNGQAVVLDANDHDPNVPVGNMVGTVSVPIQAYHGGDSDNDLIPNHVAIRWLDVSLERGSTGSPEIQTKNRDTQHQLDADAEESNSPVPFNAFDGDLDGVPDIMEPWICKIQDAASSLDGRCVKSDGTGADGSGSNYVPPMGRPNPWQTSTM